jgi:hypothetical protein
VTNENVPSSPPLNTRDHVKPKPNGNLELSVPDEVDEVAGGPWIEDIGWGEPLDEEGI